MQSVLPYAASYSTAECICVRCAHMCRRYAVQRQKEIVKISVGAQAVNKLLGGGIESRCITEIYGEFR